MPRLQRHHPTTATRPRQREPPATTSCPPGALPLRCLAAAHKGAGPPPTNCESARGSAAAASAQSPPDDGPDSIRPTMCSPTAPWLQRQCRLKTTGRPAARRRSTRPKCLGCSATTTVNCQGRVRNLAPLPATGPRRWGWATPQQTPPDDDATRPLVSRQAPLPTALIRLEEGGTRATCRRSARGGIPDSRVAVMQNSLLMENSSSLALHFSEVGCLSQ